MRTFKLYSKNIFLHFIKILKFKNFRQCLCTTQKRVKYKLSRGEICVANFTHPVNGVCLGNYKVENILFQTETLTYSE